MSTDPILEMPSISLLSETTDNRLEGEIVGTRGEQVSEINHRNIAQIGNTYLRVLFRLPAEGFGEIIC